MSVKQNSRTDFKGIIPLPVEKYQSGNDCKWCAPAIRKEIDGHEYDYGDAEDEELDEFVIDPEKQAVAEKKHGFRDIEDVMTNIGHLAVNAKSAHGREFWAQAVDRMRNEIRYVESEESGDDSAQDALPIPTAQEKPAAEPVKKAAKKTAASK
ncbi:hypothetical protein ACFU99_00795 [Streptomyces sp. NPDC057654]|uniref:hypothetical protein n=1 Tax=Streptomyces sp. NPDC057654 TaxID=3346196 RepID=UPI00369C3D41